MKCQIIDLNKPSVLGAALAMTAIVALANWGSPAMAQSTAPVLIPQVQIPDSAYRKDQGAVLTPPPPVPAAQSASFLVDPPIYNQAQFGTAYTRAGRPSMVVFWNRELTDTLEQTSNAYLSVDRSVNRNSTPDGVSGSSNVTLSSGVNKSQEARRDNPEERINFQLRASFVQALRNAGVRIVDRNLAMRKTASDAKSAASAKKANVDLDVQGVEMSAMSKYANYLLEVQNTPDKASPSGWSTLVSIKNLSDGTVVMEGYFNGQRSTPERPVPQAQPTGRYEPDPKGGGYRLVVDAPPPMPQYKPLTTQDLGRRIGEETLSKLTQAL